MRTTAIVLFWLISTAALPASAKPILWVCDMKPSESRAVGPDTYEEVDGVLIASRGDFDPTRLRYKITQESNGDLIAERPMKSGESMGLDVLLLNKKTGKFRSVFAYTNGWIESLEGKCAQK